MSKADEQKAAYIAWCLKKSAESDGYTTESDPNAVIDPELMRRLPPWLLQLL